MRVPEASPVWSCYVNMCVLAYAFNGCRSHACVARYSGGVSSLMTPRLALAPAPSSFLAGPRSHIRMYALLTPPCASSQ